MRATHLTLLMRQGAKLLSLFERTWQPVSRQGVRHTRGNGSVRSHLWGPVRSRKDTHARERIREVPPVGPGPFPKRHTREGTDP